MRICLLAGCLMLSGCGFAATGGAMLVLTVADKAFDITESVAALIRPVAVGPSCPVVAPVGWALAGSRQ